MAGLVLAPGASAGRDQPALVAIDEAMSASGVRVERVDFPYRLAGRRAPDRPPVLISALTGDGVADLRRDLDARIPLGHWLYPEDEISNVPMRALASEITREKIYLRLHEELPYAAAVETTAFAEVRRGAVRIEQTIYVERESQRPIVLGRGGQTLKWIGEAARTELGEMLDRTVHLFLTVKVKENWSEAREFYTSVGLDFDV